MQTRTQYDAWGNVRAEVGESWNPFGFTGHELDDETGLYYAKARFYDPEVGRFLSEDPWQGQSMQPPSLHKYLYAYQNPTVWTDPTGRIGQRTASPEEVEGNIESLEGDYERALSLADSLRGLDEKIEQLKEDARSGNAPANGGSYLSDLLTKRRGLASDIQRLEGVISQREGNLRTDLDLLAGINLVVENNRGLEAQLLGVSLANEGREVVGEEVTFDTSQGTTRLDLIAVDSEGEMVGVECKNGPCARVSGNQRRNFEALETEGGVPRGSNARDANLSPGQEVPPFRIEVRHVDEDPR